MTTPTQTEPLSVFLTDPKLSSPEYLARMGTFVKSHYPYSEVWTTDLLNHCWLVEVSSGPDLAALVWFNPAADGVIECHACAAPEWRGRWMTRRVVDTIANGIIEQTKCRYAVAQVPSPFIARLWRRMGFEVHDTIATLQIQENEHGGI